MKAPFKKGDLVIGTYDDELGQWRPLEPSVVYRVWKDRVYFSKEEWVYWNGAVNDEPNAVYVRKVYNS